jgi:putative zinc finger/helix-turn-helix YgiT family protein
MNELIEMNKENEVKAMKAFCPNCEKDTKQKFMDKVEEISIRGEMMPIHMEYYHCEECGEDFEIPRPDYDPLDAAYREYRNRKGMVQPEEIKKTRKELGLTQKELSKILGIGIATLNRYENGALQSEAHDQAIRLSMQPANMLQILENKPELLSESTRNRVIQHIQDEDHDCGDLLEEAIEQFGSYSPDLLSGFIRFNANKLFQAIKFFCYQDRVTKTKLNKLLFYADFKHFKDKGVSISGARYAHAYYGPVLHNFDTWLTAISEWDKQISIDEQLFGDMVGEVYTSRQPDWSVFSTSELAVLAFVKDNFQKYSAGQIRDFSHQEIGYRNTKDGEIISYQYAQELQI